MAVGGAVVAALSWSSKDRAPWLTALATLGVLAALGLRVIGVPPVDLHPPLHYLGIMDPLCGGTRATFLLLAGHPAAAAHYNPVVFPLAALVVIALLRGALGATTGRWLDIRLSRGARRALLVAAVVAVGALAARQQWNAELLMQAWPAPEPR